MNINISLGILGEGQEQGVGEGNSCLECGMF